MVSHSKRNTSRPVFTSHERNLAKSDWTTGSARLNRDSFLPFGSCGLCLNAAREPVACQKGDIFCRECALSNILAQKKDLQRADKSKQHAENELVKAKGVQENEERQRAIRDFEETQAGLNSRSGDTISKETPKEASTPQIVSDNDSKALVKVTKRKFELDPEEVLRVDQEDRAKARKAIDAEKAAQPRLPSFWTPSLTPEAKEGRLKAQIKKHKASPTCPSSSSDNLHLISLQKLIDVQFDKVVDESTHETGWTCPACRKNLTNASKPVMAKVCGHVLCFSCVQKFLVAPLKVSKATKESELLTPMCYVCDAVLSTRPTREAGDEKNTLPHGMVSLRSEGTGFSSNGKSQVKRSDVTFAC